MYFLTDHVERVSTHVFEPAAEQVLRHIINSLGFTELLADRIYLKSGYSDIIPTVDKDQNRPLTNDRLFCEVVSSMDPRSLEWDMLNAYHISSQNNSYNKLKVRYPVFWDHIHRYGLMVQEVPTGIALECEIQLKDKNIAHQFMSKMFSLYSNGDTMVVTDLLIDYPIPDHVIAGLKKLFLQTDNTDENFISYLKKRSGGAITVIKNRYLDKYEIVVQKHLVDVVAKINFGDNTPNPVKTGRLTTKFTNSFSVVFQISRPSDIYLSFPLTINNQVVPLEMIPQNKEIPAPIQGVYYPDKTIHEYLKYINGGYWLNMLKYYSKEEIERYRSQGAIYTLLKEMYVRQQRFHILRTPSYDRWFPPEFFSITKAYQYNPFCSVAFAIAEQNEPEGAVVPTTINLIEILRDTLDVHEEVLDVLKAEGKAVLDFSTVTKLKVWVYRDNIKLDPSHIDIQGNELTIQSTDIYCTHRVLVEYLIKENRNDNVPAFLTALFRIRTHIEQRA